MGRKSFLISLSTRARDRAAFQAALKELVVVRSGQRVFTDIVSEYLTRISYDPKDTFARMIRLPEYERAEVLVDPDRSFGQPIFT